MTLTPRRLFALVAVVLVGVTLGFAWRVLWTEPDRAPVHVREGTGFGSAQIGGPFTLIDQNGRPRSDGEFRGRLMFVFFGYTFCPDICPLSLQRVNEVLDQLGPASEQIAPLFITVDPARDTSVVLKTYLDHFSPRVVGLTGTSGDIAAVVKAYRGYHRINGDPSTNPNYLVDHTTLIYVMDRQGRFLTQFTHETPPERIVAALKPHL